MDAGWTKTPTQIWGIGDCGVNPKNEWSVCSTDELQRWSGQGQLSVAACVDHIHMDAACEVLSKGTGLSAVTCESLCGYYVHTCVGWEYVLSLCPEVSPQG